MHHPCLQACFEHQSPSSSPADVPPAGASAGGGQEIARGSEPALPRLNGSPYELLVIPSRAAEFAQPCGSAARVLPLP